MSPPLSRRETFVRLLLLLVPRAAVWRRELCRAVRSVRLVTKKPDLIRMATRDLDRMMGLDVGCDVGDVSTVPRVLPHLGLVPRAGQNA
jgi:hypothetical protein